MIAELLWFYKNYTFMLFIPAVALFIFSLYFSLGPLRSFEELKNSEGATRWMAAGMFISLLIILTAGNFFSSIFHGCHFFSSSFSALFRSEEQGRGNRVDGGGNFLKPSDHFYRW